MTGDGLNPDDAVSAVRNTVEQSGKLPAELSYVEQEPGDEERDIHLPALILHPLSAIRIVDHNTDFDGYVTDSNGNRTGRVFTAEYRLDIQLDIWTASGSSYDERTLGNALHTALYPHDSNGPGKSLIGDDGQPIESVWKFRLNDGEQANDLTGTPTLRRWRQDVSMWAYHRFDTTADYSSTVSYPSDLSDDDGSGQLTG